MEHDLNAAVAEARREIEHLRRRLDAIEQRSSGIQLPNTALLDPSFLKRAFAVLGHYFVAAMIIALPFYFLVFMVIILTEGFM